MYTNCNLKSKDFNHKVQIRVRTFDVDSQGVVHNINFLKFVEIGRVEYFRNLGYNFQKNGIFYDNLKVVVVRNEIDYLSFAYLDELLNVYTRIIWIKNSSFCFESLIENNDTKIIISTAKGILVNLNSNNKASNIPEKLINEISLTEKKLTRLK